jgi:hypothetical protein
MMKVQEPRRKSLVTFVLLYFFFFFMGTGAENDLDTGGQARLEISVMSGVGWTDAGLDVFQGQEVYFRARGQISLQRGNPVTYCGPDGYNYQSTQQPLRDKNIGALIGKVYLLISVEVDEKTGEEVRNELEELFYIGSANRIVMPMTGRLFLGVNENLVADNEGTFTVIVFTDISSSDHSTR